MHEIKLTVDVNLPAMAGGTTTDLATIQENILAIQSVCRRKIYSPGDIRQSHVLVVTGVNQFICVISLRMREMSGYMSFINTHTSEFAALGIFNILCPIEYDDKGEMKERFIDTYRQIKSDGQTCRLPPVCFSGRRKARQSELVH